MMGTQLQQPANQTPSKLSSLIRKCEDLPLEIFIRIKEDGDHTRLGEGDTAVAWRAILAQYDELTGGEDYKYMLKLMQEINYLSVKLRQVGLITAVMEKYYVPKFGEILANYGFKYEWEFIDPELRDKQLTHIISSSKTWYIQLKAKEKEWDRLTAPDPKFQKRSTSEREYYEGWLIDMSKEQGYHMSTQTTTVYQFALLLNQTVAKVKANAKAKK